MKTLPALKAAILIAVGIAVARWVAFPFVVLSILVTLPLILSIALDRHPYSQWFLALSLAASGTLLLAASQPPGSFQPVRVNVIGRVTEPPHFYRDRVTFPLRVQRMGPELPADGGFGRLWVHLARSKSGIATGKVIEAEGLLHSVRERRNPGDFDLKGWRQRNGYLGELLVQRGNRVKVGKQEPPPIYRLRNWIAAAAERYGGNDAPLLKALLLGYRRELDPEMVEDLKRTGLSHLLALSGLHVGFLILIFIGVGALFRLPPSWRCTLALAALALFILLVPARSSTLRAAIMAGTLLSGTILRRWSPPLNSLALAGLIIFCIRPGDLFDAGFQLSFAAVGGIILFQEEIEAYSRQLRPAHGRIARLVKRYLITPFLVSLAAAVMVVPLTSYHFGLMALGTPLFNLVAIPLLWFIFAGAWVTVVAAAIWSVPAWLVADGVAAAAFVWKGVAELFARITPTWYVHLAPISIALWLGALIWMSRSSRGFPFRLTVGAALLATILLGNGIISGSGGFQAWFLDVGHGDAAVWLFPDGKTAVIDGGPATAEWRSGVVVNALNRLNRSRVDLIVASHPDADHIGGLGEVVRWFPVGLALTNTSHTTTSTLSELLDVSSEKGVVWQRTGAGCEVRGLPEGCRLTVLGPPPGSETWSDNEASLVMLLEVPTGGDKPLRLLMTGDIERLGEQALLAGGDIRAELLKVPHHGSPTSSSPEFLIAVSPEAAVASLAGWDERSRFRSPEKVFQRLREQGVELHQTGLEGAVLFKPVPVSGKAHWRAVDWRHPSFIRWLLGLT